MNQVKIDQFQRDGFLLLNGIADAETLGSIRQIAEHGLGARISPFELEADVQYPGSPASVFAEGGETIRRLRQAWQRNAVLADWAKNPRVVHLIQQLLGGNRVLLTQAHHNCIMTKHPSYSSETLWHRDCRYWNFTDCNLVSAWLALGEEQKNNGALLVVPGSHRLALEQYQFDQATFFRQDIPENQELLARAVQLELAPGDVLLFHAQLLHAAGRNVSSEPKMALVFTYHNEATQPVAGTRSAQYPEIQVS